MTGAAERKLLRRTRLLTTRLMIWIAKTLKL